LPDQNADKPEVGTGESGEAHADFDEWVEASERLASDIRTRLQEADVDVAEYPQRQFMVPDMELYTVLEAIGPGGIHAMPRARCRRIIDEFRLRSGFPSNPEREELKRQLVQAFRDAEDVGDFDGLRDTFASRITGIICAGDEQTFAELATLIEDTSIISCEVIAITLEVIGAMWHPQSYRNRRLLLEKNLGTHDATIRTGAVLGLSNLSSPLSLPSLRNAHDAETDDVLKSTIDSTIRQLEQLSP
jgi:hypothetical protein